MRSEALLGRSDLRSGFFRIFRKYSKCGTTPYLTPYLRCSCAKWDVPTLMRSEALLGRSDLRSGFFAFFEIFQMWHDPLPYPYLRCSCAKWDVPTLMRSEALLGRSDLTGLERFFSHFSEIFQMWHDPYLTPISGAVAPSGMCPR